MNNRLGNGSPNEGGTPYGSSPFGGSPYGGGPGGDASYGGGSGPQFASASASIGPQGGFQTGIINPVSTQSNAHN